AEVVSCLEAKSINEALEKYGAENEKTIMEYLEYLENNAYGFFCTKKERKRFPGMDLKFETPNHITNAVLEMEKMDREKAASVFEQLCALKCESVHLLFYSTITTEDIQYIIQLSRNNTLTSIEITAKFNPDPDEIQLAKINKTPNKIVRFIFYASDKTFAADYGDPYLFKVIYVKTPAISNT
ncbi:MAG: hypothetical protein KDD04_12935, partial [Sinomicrobium sp.]|nr:hypothetical protein [Sinomicrobium sp.]